MDTYRNSILFSVSGKHAIETQRGMNGNKAIYLNMLLRIKNWLTINRDIDDMFIKGGVFFSCNET